MTGPVGKMLDDGRRLHLQHGPIDLIIEAWGPEEAVTQAYAQAAKRFETVLDELVAELPALRKPLGDTFFAGDIARRMRVAVAPHRETFITPMAAVAGAVADEVLAALIRDRVLEKAYVNNGGDIAVHLSRGASFDVGMVTSQAVDGRLTLTYADPVRGIATSGRGGRSLSLGIADAVTVLAPCAADADAAATLIANRVDIPGCAAITRAPACNLDPDSDLGARLVTVAVGPLRASDVEKALAAGRHAAEGMIARGLIHAAALSLNGRSHIAGYATEREALHA